MGFGIGAGLLSGMFGLGGGIIIVPGLMFALKMDQRLAHGTSLGGVFLISCASFMTYWTHDEVDWHVVLWLALGSVCGSLIGARLLATLSKRTLTISFMIVGDFVKTHTDHFVYCSSRDRGYPNVFQD